MGVTLPHFIQLNNQAVPRFFYGTAWKEEATAQLTYNALKNGFRAIDTANQRKHYYEEGAGVGIQQFLSENEGGRQDLFLQTKFTFARGQDHRRPYDESDSFSKQVADSFKSSLEHLNTDYIDSFVLHGPHDASGIGDADLEVWEAMEKLYENKQVHMLGVSNISADQLRELCQKVRIRPSFVQNRCFARTGWDQSVRAVCSAEGMVYQGFSLLTANSHELSQELVAKLGHKYKKTVPQIVFRFCQQIGMITLTGTTKEQHMLQDLDIYDFELTKDEVQMLEKIGL